MKKSNGFYFDHISWFSLKTRINDRFQGGRGHFFPKGAIVNAFLGNNIGYEKSGQRPVLIISNDIINSKSGNVLIAPLTKSENKEGKKLLNTQYILYRKDHPFLNFDSFVQCEDIRSISKERLGNVLGFIQDGRLKEINKRLKYTFGL